MYCRPTPEQIRVLVAKNRGLGDTKSLSLNLRSEDYAPRWGNCIFGEFLYDVPEFGETAKKLDA